MKIVYVDEKPGDSSDSLLMLLSLCGHDVTLVTDYKDAMPLIIMNQPDVILTRIYTATRSLPFDLMGQLKTDYSFDLVRVAILNTTLGTNREMALAAGFDRVLTVPVAPEELFEAIV